MTKQALTPEMQEQLDILLSKLTVKQLNELESMISLEKVVRRVKNVRKNK